MRHREISSVSSRFPLLSEEQPLTYAFLIAGWSSLVARQAHNLKVAGSNPAPATSSEVVLGAYGCCLSSWKARCYLLRFALFVFDGLSVRPRRRFGLLATKFDYLPGFLDNFCPRICPSFGQFQVGFKADDVV